MDLSSVLMTEIYGGILLFIIGCIILVFFINDFIRKRMVFACRKVLLNKEKVVKISVDNKTADYLTRNNNHELYRVNEFISKENGVIKYRLCLKKRSFDFYLKKQNLWNYNVVAIKMY
ncbi:hypothetical protein [Companilactobacillus nuruki]|uniref:Uncharacterized protein n=1 Tax=Companilactobacillus nuruki TaxID=1993540 RepID=A0A2N7AXW7_9LACO|nr:hypothetical protein [Companilactobacillus nuruki]PMD73906.1 hypothetical protein CBP76_00750 [Companilactobacillus nuruki]